MLGVWPNECGLGQDLVAAIIKAIAARQRGAVPERNWPKTKASRPRAQPKKHFSGLSSAVVCGSACVPSCGERLAALLRCTLVHNICGCAPLLGGGGGCPLVAVTFGIHFGGGVVGPVLDVGTLAAAGGPAGGGFGGGGAGCVVGGAGGS